MNNKQNVIVHVTSVHIPFDTRIFEKMCKSAFEREGAVTLVAPHDRNDTVDGINIKGVKMPVNRLLRATIGGAKVAWESWKVGGNLYHFHDPELIIWVRIFRLLGKRVVYDMHENVPKSIVSKTWIPTYIRVVVKKLWTLFEKIFLFNIPIVFAESSYRADYEWVRDYEVVLNMPKAKYLLGLDNTKHKNITVVYLGRISPERGSFITLKALKLLEKEGVNVSFHCIGASEAKHQEQLEEMIDAYDLSEVKLFGFMSPQKAWEEISRCHIGMAVLSKIPNYENSYPTKIFEYMALGMPVITSDFPLYKSVVENAGCGVCVNPADEHEIARAIRELVVNDSIAKRLGQSGRDIVSKKYNWEVEAEKLFRFYNEKVLV